MEPELIALATNSGPAAVITAMILFFLRPLRAAVIDWFKKATETK